MRIVGSGKALGGTQFSSMHAAYDGLPETMKLELEGIGADGTVSSSPEEFAALVRTDTARYAKIVKDIGLRMD